MTTTIAIIGLGPMGIRHLRASIQIPHLQVVGIADLRQSVITEVTSEYNLPDDIGFVDYKIMLNEIKPELVVIATNGPSHYSIFLDVIKSGVKKVFCEKPIATSISEAREIVNLAKQQDVDLLINHARRWSHDYLLLKDKLSKGIIGPVESIIISMGGGQLACNGTHMVDLVSYILDKRIKNVLGFLNDESILNPRGEQFKDPGGYGIYHYEDGTRLFLEMTDDLGIPPFILIQGRYGRVRIDEINRYYEIETRTEPDRMLPTTRYATPLSKNERVEIADLDIIQLCTKGLKSLTEGHVLADAESAVQSLEAIVAIHYSNQLGNQLIELPLDNTEILRQKFQFT